MVDNTSPGDESLKMGERGEVSSYRFFFFSWRHCFPSLWAGWKGTVMGRRKKEEEEEEEEEKNVMEREKCFVFLGGRGGNDCQTKSGKTNVWVEHTCGREREKGGGAALSWWWLREGVLSARISTAMSARTHAYHRLYGFFLHGSGKETIKQPGYAVH